MSKVLEIAKNSKSAQGFMAAVRTAQKNILLESIALKLAEHSAEIVAANEEDIKNPGKKAFLKACLTGLCLIMQGYKRLQTA